MKELYLLIEKARAEHSHLKGWSIHELNNNALRIMYYPHGIRMNCISIAFSCTLTEPNAVDEACRFIEDRLNKPCNGVATASNFNSYRHANV